MIIRRPCAFNRAKSSRPNGSRWMEVKFFCIFLWRCAVSLSFAQDDGPKPTDDCLKNMNPIANPFRLYSCCICLLLSLATLLLPSSLRAEEIQHRFLQEAQPLADALEDFSRTTGIDVLSRSEWLESKQAPALSGELTASEALNQLLSESGLVFRFTSPQMVAVLTPDEANTASPIQLPLVKVTAQAEDAVQLPEVVVEARKMEAYRVERAPTSTKLNIPLHELPQSVSVIPQQVIEDQQILRIGDIAHNVSGVTRRAGYGGNVDNFNIRGFPSRNILKNGFLLDNFITVTEMANVQSVEILKGPIGALFGQNEPGGIVNIVTKKPLLSPQYVLDATVGSYDFYRGAADLTGPLNQEQTLAYRLNLAMENSGSFRNFVERESVFAAPAMTWLISPKTTLIVEGEYLHFDGTFDRAFLPEAPFFDIPLDRFLGEKFSNRESDHGMVSYELVHQMTDTWRVRHASLFNSTESDIVGVQPRSLEADGRTLNRRVHRSNESTTDFVTQNELHGSFETGPVQHDVVTGVEIGYDYFDYDFDIAPLASIDIFNPQYGAQPGTFLNNAFAEEYYLWTIAGYAHDVITLTPKWKMLLGGRLDYVEGKWRDLVNDDLLSDENFLEFSPRAGLVYQPVPSQSLFFSFSRSFQPDIFGRTRDDEPLSPVTGEQFEGGIKSQWFDERLTTTASLFHISKQNVPTSDPVDPDFLVQTGEVISRGLELEASGELRPGWKLIANYTYTDAYVSEDNDLPEGDELVNTPRHAAGLWNVYEFQTGWPRGLSFGAGAFYVGEREADLPNTAVKLPDYVRVDAMIGYRRDFWKATLGLKNLFDEEIYDSQGFFIEPQPPLSVVFNLEFVL